MIIFIWYHGTAHKVSIYRVCKGCEGKTGVIVFSFLVRWIHSVFIFAEKYTWHHIVLLIWALWDIPYSFVLWHFTVLWNLIQLIFEIFSSAFWLLRRVFTFQLARENDILYLRQSTDVIVVKFNSIYSQIRLSWFQFWWILVPECYKPIRRLFFRVIFILVFTAE